VRLPGKTKTPPARTEARAAGRSAEIIGFRARKLKGETSRPRPWSRSILTESVDSDNFFPLGREHQACRGVTESVERHCATGNSLLVVSREQGSSTPKELFEGLGETLARLSARPSICVGDIASIGPPSSPGHTYLAASAPPSTTASAYTIREATGERPRDRHPSRPPSIR
jgi:hypothetical protein